MNYSGFTVSHLSWNNRSLLANRKHLKARILSDMTELTNGQAVMHYTIDSIQFSYVALYAI